MATRSISERGYSHVSYRNVEDYVKARGGQRAIKKVLIANNGIGAVKCIRSIRTWAYEAFGNEREIQFLSMATPEDLRANAEYIRMADEFVEVPGGSNVNNYANVTLIVQIAERYNVDAVWAGWGHASENPDLPNTLDEMGIVFIGPPGAPMYALGDKIGSTIIAQSAKVPTIAWNGMELTVDYKATGTVPKEIYDKANVTNAKDCYEAVKKVGLPVMIKASEGGGGKGIRMVDNLEGVEAAYRQVSSEIPGSPIFVMKLASAARHLEVQLLADAHGNAIALNGRDCSVQRRHQKILEEGPPIAALPAVWKEMCAAAVRLAKEVGYVNAGTVEYLYCDNEFFFLELNPRLQVEHPVTEMITGVNLPAAQLKVAMGIPLHQISDIRTYFNKDPNGTEEIDFDNEEPRPPQGHCIASRITAENPYEGFQPTSGQIQEINFRSSRNVWGYFSVDSSGRVHEFADSQIGHLFAWGENREQARKNLVIALKDLSIRGDIRTTVEYLNDLIEAKDYRENKFDTAWLDARIKKQIKNNKVDSLTVILVGAAIQAYTTCETAEKDYMDNLERGQLPPSELIFTTVPVELIYESIKYTLSVERTGPATFLIHCNGSSVDVEIRQLADGGFLILCGGKSHVAYTKEEVGALRVVVDGQTCLFAEEYDPTKLRAQMGGKLLRYLVEDGEQVAKNAPFAEIEVMKMNMQLLAKEAGVVHIQKPEGAVMEPGDIICTMTLDDPSKVKKADVFTDKLPELGEPWPRALETNPHHTLEDARKTLQYAMDGYKVPAVKITDALKNLALMIQNPLLPLLEVEELLSRVKNSIPFEVYDKLSTLGRTLRENISKSLGGDVSQLPVVGLNRIGSKHFNNQEEEKQSQSESNRSSLKFAEEYCAAVVATIESGGNDITCEPIVAIAKKYTSGMRTSHLNILAGLINSYVDTESAFAEVELSETAEKDDVLQELRRENASNLPRVHQLSYAHASLGIRNQLMIYILNALENIVRIEDQDKSTKLSLREKCVEILRNIGTLNGQSTTDVALEARQLLIELQEASHDEQIAAVQAQLQKVASGDQKELAKMIDSTDAKLHFFIETISGSQDPNLRKAALELYIRRLYSSYNVEKVTACGDSVLAKFLFSSQPAESLSMGGATLSNASSFDDLTALLSESMSQKGSSRLGFDDGGSVETSSSLGLDLDGGNQPAEKSNNRVELKNVAPDVQRQGSLCYFASPESLTSGFEKVISELNSSGNNTNVNVVHVILDFNEWPNAEETDATEGLSNGLSGLLKSKIELLKTHGVRRVTFATVSDRSFNAPIVSGHGNKFFTFRERSGFEEDQLVRHIETPLAYQLDLERLANFNIKAVPLGKNLNLATTVHVYEATPKKGFAKGKSDKRYFVRAIVRQTARVEGADEKINLLNAYPGPERVFVQALSALETIKESSGFTGGVAQNHIFLNVLGGATVEPSYVEAICRVITKRYAARLRNVGVSQVEMKVNANLIEGTKGIKMRIITTNPTGFALQIERYVEASDPNTNESIFYSVSEGEQGVLAAMGFSDFDDGAEGANDFGELHGKPLNTPYPVATALDLKRARAMALGTAFVYDYPALFKRALQLEWSKYGQQTGEAHRPSANKLITFEELVLDDEMDAETPVGYGLATIKRAPGTNPVAMVAWRMTLQTPEYPSGRDVIVIANDITNKAGSFGTREDEVFNRASAMAREQGLPRLYVAANSGARIGMADEVKQAFKIKFVNPEDPTKGFDYIYVTEEDYAVLGPNGRKSLIAEHVPDQGHYKIIDIIGEGRDLGVENLRGSGTIAGETSRAYDETFTLTYVSGRTVGIGAYLVRLGQRTIQKGTNAPILLTGYSALNSLMGRDVYTSNLQLGGTKVMYNNGVSHQCVRNDLEGVEAMLKWLAYVPERRGAPLPQSSLGFGDVAERDIEFHPIKMGLDEFDPRHLLTGVEVEAKEGEDTKWVSGFFDRGSFTETLAGWAKAVVVGRARLGGYPTGVIISETRTMEAKAPADPATPDSKERVWHQAGQVWFPDSAYKTAQAISDFNKEGLPLMLFANWRGFSGGQRDMFDEVLKYGAFIVDELVDYKQPVFIYIPPTGQLRGGAWVVVDPTINSEVMEMYADTDARGNVLEPSGAVSIKFREKDMLATARRTDPVLINLLEKIREGAGTPEEIAALKQQMKTREAKLLPVYKQIALHFGDLHDRPGRMMAKGVIREVVPWTGARKYFYNRLRRKLAESEAAKLILKANSNFKLESETKVELQRLYEEVAANWSDDAAVYHWLKSSEGQQSVQEYVATLRGDSITAQIKELGKDDANAVLKGLMGLISDMKSQGKSKERDELVQKLRNGVLLLN